MKNFDEIYKKIYDKYNIEIEHKRKKILIQNIVILIAFIAIYIITNIFMPYLSIFLLPIILVTGIIYFALKPYSKKFSKIYKETIISDLVSNYNPGLKFSTTGKISQSTYNNAEFESYDEFYSNDYIYGEFDGIINFEMGDIHTVNVSHTSNGRTTRTTIFQGLFSSSKLNKNLNSKIKIRSDKGLMGIFYKEKDLLHMDSQEFEKYFDVLTNNKILAMRILTSDIMDYLIQFKKDNKIKFEISIKNQSCYIRIHCSNMFEGSLLTNSLNYDKLQKYYNFLNFMCTLNKRINTTINEKDI